MSSPRVAHALFCDDIRLEAGNKLSFMGIYAGDLVISDQFPTALPKFAFIVWILADVDDAPQSVTTTIILPDNHELVKVNFPVIEPPNSSFIQQGSKKLSLSQTFPVSPLPLPCEGYLEVWVETERERMRAGRIWIHHVDRPFPPPEKHE